MSEVKIILNNMCENFSYTCDENGTRISLECPPGETTVTYNSPMTHKCLHIHRAGFNVN